MLSSSVKDTISVFLLVDQPLPTTNRYSPMLPPLSVVDSGTVDVEVGCSVV